MSDFERNKDQVQAGVQAGASLVGRIAVIITNAVGSIAKEIGDFVTECIEMREAARVSRREERQRTANDPRADQDGIDARAEDDNDPRG